jgi:hypothetical protein
LSVCLSVSEDKHSPLFAPTDVHKTSYNIEQLSVQMAIANLSYYLPFKMASSGYQTLCHVRSPVSDSSKSFLHSLVNRQADCGTAGHCSFFIVSCVVSKHSCPISTSLLHSLIFPCTNVFYVNIHSEHISIYPVLSGIEATIKLFPHCSHLTNIHSTVPPAVSVATPQSLCSQNNT